MKGKIIFLTAAMVSAALAAQAKVVLPEILSDDMVLQQGTQVSLWGLATPHSTVTVTVSWSDSPTVCEADEDGKWIVRVDTPAADWTPQTVTVSDNESSVTLSDVLLGEVWFCSGQSNMELSLSGARDCPVEGSAELIASSTQWKGIRVAKVDKTPALEPQTSVGGGWKLSNPENAPRFTAVGYTFARTLCGATDVPVGIIDCSWSGSAIEAWMPREILANYPDVDVDAALRDIDTTVKPWEWNSHLPTIMYNGMISAVCNYTVRGFLWYQGCSNVGGEATYPGKLSDMVAEWRRLWDEGDIPFYIVEIAPYNYGGDGMRGARFRECQLKASLSIPNSGMVCINDLVYPYESGQIHPCRKQEVGQRLAYMALNRTYGYTGLFCEGPRFREMTIEGDEAVLQFDNDEMGFSPWSGLTGFEVAGEDRVFHPAQARVVFGQRKVVVRSDDVPAPVAVRYCFRDFCPGNLTGALNLPAVPFRTDDWD